MKKIFFLLLANLACFSVNGSEFKDYQFEQERMLMADDGIYLISSFEDSDHVTAYSYYGDVLWDTPFFAKITSWRVAGNRIIVFSKHRNGYKTYLTCLDRYTGKMIWQKP